MQHEQTLDIIIKPIGNTWSGKVIDLILPIQQVEFNIPVTLEEQSDLLDIDQFYHRPGGGFWGALAGEVLAGTIGLIAMMNNCGVIRKMFVHKDYRGRQWNIAQRLLETLMAYCRVAGIGDLYLGTNDTMKAAMRFYERNGFVKIPVTSLPGSFPLMPVNDTFYYLHLGT